ncbi:MAG: T9SS type B sorting domain-containing protein [Bacteroidota bacterium]
MKKKYLILFLFYLFGYNLYSQGSTTCSGAEAICAGGTGLTFDNNTTFPTAETGIDYGCLGDQPYPTWFFIKIKDAGNLDFEISQVNTSGTPIDVDFIAWGPFSAPSCGPANLNSSTQVGCSFLPDTSEYFSINNTIAGQYYMLLITNYSMEAGQITLTQTNTTIPATPGAGSTDCNAVCPLSITGGGVPICAGGILTAVFGNSTSPTFQWYLNNVLIPGATGINYTPTQSGTYSVIANSIGCLPNQTASTVVPNSTPVSINPPTNPLTACSGATFNLTTNTAVILSGLNAADYDVNYHLTLNGAQNVDNSIPNPANFNGTNGQIIYISIQDLANGGCITTSQFTLSIISCTLTATNTGPICVSGTFNLNVSNAGAGYSYSWTGPNGFTSNTQNPTNVPSPTGTAPYVYTVTATGSTTITASTTVIVNQIPTVSVNNSTICAGGSTIITATPSPAGSYTYSWTVPAGVTAPGNVASFSANVNGTYSVVITNSGTSCSSNSSSGTITLTPRPIITVNNTTICPGETATITATPSVPSTYNYVWTCPAGVVNPGNVASFTTTTIGTYSVIITDTVTTCSSILTSGTVSSSPVGGALTLICGPSTPTSVNFDWNNIAGITSFNYSYSIAGGPIVTGNIVAPSNFTVPTPANLPVTFTLSPIGSVCVPSQTLTCNCPNPVINSITDIVTCGSNVVGQTNFSTSDPYDTVEWTNDNPGIGLAANGTGNFIPSFTATNSTSTIVANITVVLTKYGCHGSPRTFKITVNPLPVANISGTATKCSGTTSTISFNGTPNAIVSYTINGGSVQTITLDNFGNGSFVSPVLVSDTTYTLVSINLSGCIQPLSGNAIITIAPLPTVTVNNETICSGSNVTVTATPGIPGIYTYVWTVPSGAISPGNVASFSTNVSGIYSVIITNTSTLCSSSSASGLINVFTTPLVTVNNPLICPNGTATITATPVTSGSYSYSWTVPSGVTNPGNISSFNTNVLGNYTVNITDTTTNCVSANVTGTVSISPASNVIINPAIPTPICSGSTTNISLSSAVAGTTFTWTAAQTGVFGVSSGTGNTISQTLTTVGAVTGTVTYTITPMSNGCIGIPASITVTVNPVPEVFGTSNSIICSGDSTDISLSPNIAGTTFTWTVVQIGLTGATNATGFNINDILVTTGTNIGQAIYTVTPTYNGCSGQPITITVLVNPAPIANIQDGVICVTQATGETFQNYLLNTQLNTNFYDFTWYFNGAIISNAANIGTYTAEEVGTYGVVVKNNITGCVSPMITADVIAYFPGEISSITQTAAFSDNGTIVVNIDGTGTYQYQIDGGVSQNSNTFSNLSAGLHTISVIDIYGCTSVGPITISLIGYPHFFTPNGDGTNDTWNVVGLNNVPSKILIYDRHGKLIKQMSSSGLGWDGTYNGVQMPSTDYWFVIEYIENGENKIFKSHFSMKR